MALMSAMAAALLPASAAGAAPSSASDSALFKLDRDLAVAYEEAAGAGAGLPDAEFAALCARIDALEWKIAETPAHTLAGVAIKLRRLLDTESGEHGASSPWLTDALQSILEAVERLGGPAVLPRGQAPRATLTAALWADLGGCQV